MVTKAETTSVDDEAPATTIEATPESTTEKVNMQVKTETEAASVEDTAANSIGGR